MNSSRIYLGHDFGGGLSKSNGLVSLVRSREWGTDPFHPSPMASSLETP